MLALRAVGFYEIQKHFVDFQKKSKCFEMPPDGAEFIGIYQDDTLIGYFVLVGYDNSYVEVNQGYLLPKYRHLGLPAQSLHLMEDLCKRVGYTEIRLGTHNRFRSYLKFMRDNGYKPEHLVFSKVI